MNLDHGLDAKGYSGRHDLEDTMYTIGKVARLAGVSTDTLRYYENPADDCAILDALESSLHAVAA